MRSRTPALPSTRRESGASTSRRAGVERLYGGLEPALRRALAAVGTAWDPRAGAAQRRFAALAAANVARPGQILVVSDERLQRFPRAAAAGARADGAAPPRGAARARREARRTACWAPGRSRGRTIGAGRPARLEPGERRQGCACARAPSAGRDRRGARVSRGGRKRADVAARVRCAARDAARAAGARRPVHSQDRAVGATRRRRLVAALGDVARCDDGGRVG